ncbi:hypothetical protein ABVV53_08085 [Novosphingobium sp. RD2P27]|uniref:Uncharacterized protein n=1 Tax=Novosphingobium kalidii TaxID=3230299 RepID=A0ABV2D0M0_9SPHN
MLRRSLPIFVVLVVGHAYWLLVSHVEGVEEPWDAEAYWALWYPGSILLSAGAGVLLRRLGWVAGALFTFCQLPIMWLNNGSGPLWGVGFLFLCLLAIPAGAASSLAGRLARRGQRP